MHGYGEAIPSSKLCRLVVDVFAKTGFQMITKEGVRHEKKQCILVKGTRWKLVFVP